MAIAAQGNAAYACDLVGNLISIPVSSFAHRLLPQPASEFQSAAGGNWRINPIDAHSARSGVASVSLRNKFT